MGIKKIGWVSVCVVLVEPWKCEKEMLAVFNCIILELLKSLFLLCGTRQQVLHLYM